MQVFNVVISKMVTAVLWTSPFGIASLIAASICRACDLASTLAALGLWVVTVLLGLLLQGGLVLPAALWACTRQSPWATIKGFSQAIVLGFGTSSSSAALPVRPTGILYQCLLSDDYCFVFNTMVVSITMPAASKCFEW